MDDLRIIIGVPLLVIFGIWGFVKLPEIIEYRVSTRTFYVLATLALLAMIASLAYQGEPILTNLLFYAALAIAGSVAIAASRWGWSVIKQKSEEAATQNPLTPFNIDQGSHAEGASTPTGGNVTWQEAAATINELFQAAIRADKFGELDAMIDQVCTLTRFAPWNAFLIAVQRPGALAVATPRDWAEDFDRRVIPGARPIVILQPFGPVAFLYELKDTIGKAHPRLDAADPFAVKKSGLVLVEQKDIDAVASTLLRRDRIEVRLDDLGGAMPGLALSLHQFDKANVTLDKEGSVAFLVRLANWQSPPECLVTLFHELAHIFCGHLGVPLVRDPKTGDLMPPKWDDRKGALSEGQREFEAECTAHIVARRIGLETKSAQYLASYVDKDDADAISVAHIVTAMSRIEKLLPKRLLPNRRQVYQRPND